jgi:uncharacterized membrane protein YdjX (TVP38/TMEM64 family)
VPSVRRIRLSRRHLFIGALATIAVIALWRLPVAAWAVSLAERLRGMGTAGVALFVVVYVLAEIILLPAVPFTMAAGFAYGPVNGFLIVSPASLAAATAAFLLSRTALRDRIRSVIQRHTIARALDRSIATRPFWLILLLRLSPAVPFNILNYALGLSSVSVGRYVLASFIGMIPGTWMYVYLGSLMTTAAEIGQGRDARSPAEWALLAVGLVATIAAVAVVTRAARRALDAELPAAREGQRVHEAFLNASDPVGYG